MILAVHSMRIINFDSVKTYFLFLLMVALASSSCAQAKKDLLIGLQTDLIKTNNSGYFQRFQTGAEGNYFFHNRFTITGGIEYWTESRQLSLVSGVRWYPVDEAFLRLRGLLGANDFAIGGGWSRPVKENLRFEAMSDFYFAGHITIRAGFTYKLLSIP
jgi:hypothetical protein